MVYLSLGLVAGLVIAYFLIPAWQEFINEAYNVIRSGERERISDWIRQYGWWGPAIIILTMVMQINFQFSFLIFPFLARHSSDEGGAKAKMIYLFPFFTYYLLPITYYLLPITYYLLPSSIAIALRGGDSPSSLAALVRQSYAEAEALRRRFNCQLPKALPAPCRT